MKNIINLLIGAVAAGIVLPASAQISLSLSPTSSTVALNGTATYSITISGLKGSYDYNGPALGGFTIELDYDSTIASAQAVSFGTSLNLSGTDFQYSDLSTPGQIYFTETSFDLAAALETSQTSSFTLGTITLQGVSLGTTTVSFDAVFTSLSDENAHTLDLISTTGASLTVVPEPGAGALAALAMGLLGLRRKLA